MSSSYGNSVPGADRTLAVLELLSGAGEAGRTAAEIARALGLPANSTCRLLEVLRTRRWAESEGRERRWRLTGKMLELARPRAGERSLGALAFEPLQALRDATGETAQFCVRSRDRCVILEQVAAHEAVKVLGEPGLRVPLYSCAPGKAILAALPEAELDAWFRRVSLKRFTPTTLATREALLKEFRAIRRQGYAVDRAEGLEGIHCVGAAVLDARDYPAAGITVIGPAFRLKSSRFAEAGRRVVAAAEEISRRLRA
jgi:IclR family acetate operon transcriptional repressor